MTEAYKLDWCGGSFPTQAEGRTADDRPFYFRARHGTWTLELGEKGWPTDSVDWPDYDRPLGHAVIASGVDPSYGCMTQNEVELILRKHLPEVTITVKEKTQ